ncbi:integral peroxisomal membrane peroxin-domain-containing protein [Leucosporidium creatinivorum]|uniref:Integral peroxisomal membrane peroxin-domain-containing protein n=1 Tax=Leucosporidium creatinivorum TaxID=106004 RepID=A0A1Y2FRX2_9BASI|nr:integral peroxisomal membrane peroxin-domain-containing protein [Leucosporidium creatinivorum]
MTIKISERTLHKHKEFRTRYKHGEGGIEHHPRGFTGRVQHSSLVAHCAATSRSFVFLPTLDGVAPSKNLLEVCKEGVEYASDGKKDESIEVLVILYDEPDTVNDSRVAAFPPALRAFLRSHPLAFRLELLPPVKTKAEAFTVDKSSGTVTLLSCPPGRPSKSAEVSRFDPFFTNAGMLLGLDSITQATLENSEYLYWRQYEGDHESKTLPILPRLTRSRLLSRRAAKGGHTAATMEEIFKLRDLHLGAAARIETNEQGVSPWTFVDATIDSLFAVPPSCIICAKEGSLFKCGGCGWEYYCSSEHQQQDWPCHKSWCKANPKSKTLLTTDLDSLTRREAVKKLVKRFSLGGEQQPPSPSASLPNSPSAPTLDTLWTDPSLRYLAPMAPPTSSTSPTRPSPASALLSSSTPHLEEPTPTDLLLATPPTVLKFLSLSAPIIQALTHADQLLNWQGSFWGSLLVLLGWWTACLFGEFLLRYGLPALVLLYILGSYLSTAASRHPTTKGALPSRRHHHLRPTTTLTPATYTTLLNSSQLLASHIQSFRATVIHPITLQLSFTPAVAGRPTPAYQTAWFAITSYPFYLLLTFLVPMRIIFLVLGSVGILWNAPFFCTLRITLWRSAAVRWVCRLLYGLLSGGRGLKKEWARTKSGVGIPGLLGKAPVVSAEGVEEKPVKVAGGGNGAGEHAEADEGEDVQVQFTVFENQRWWVGLDWTHALLPGERASWTDPALNPANPPSSFLLPPPSIAYTASPTRQDPTSRLKRTTEWKWLDPEWRVMRTPTSSSPLTHLGSVPAVDPRGGANEGSMAKSASVQSLPASLVPHPQNPEADGAPSFPPALGDETLFKDWTVDEEGWQYGDNHFEKMGPKGGLGKYTRRRAWVRRAGLVERCERVSGPEGEKLSLGSSTSGSGLGTVGVGVGLGRGRERSESGGRSKERERGREKSVGEPEKEKDSLRRRKSSNAASAGKKKEGEGS